MAAPAIQLRKEAAVGWKVEVFWEEEEKVFTGVIVKFVARHGTSGPPCSGNQPCSCFSSGDSDRHAILYDDDDCVFWSDLEQEQVGTRNQPGAHQPPCRLLSSGNWRARSLLGGVAGMMASTER